MMKFYSLLFIMLSFLLTSCGKKVKDSSDKNKIDIHTPPVAVDNVSQADKMQLLIAINSHDTNLVEQSLLKNQNIDYIFTNGETPLTYAIKWSKPEVIQQVMAKTKNINLSNKDGESPLLTCINQYNKGQLSQILKRNADVNLADNLGNTPLIAALKTSQVRVAVKLLIYKANYHFHDDNKELIDSLFQQDKFLPVKKLIMQIEGKEKSSPEYFNNQIKNGNIDFVHYLLENFTEYKKWNKENNFLNSVMDIENKRQRDELLKILLAHQASPNMVRDDGLPLSKAIRLKQYTTIRILMNNAADPIYSAGEVPSPFEVAVSEFEEDIVKFFYLKLLTDLNLDTDNEQFKIIIKKSCDELYFNLEQDDISTDQSRKAYRIESLLKCHLR